MFSSLKQKAKKMGLILALGSATAVMTGCAEKDTRSQAQKNNDALVELAQKSGRYTVSSEFDDKDKGYYSDAINNTFVYSDFITDYVYKNQGKKSIDESMLDALFLLKKENKLSKVNVSTQTFPFFVQNYGAHNGEKTADWLVRFEAQAKTAKELRNSGKTGLVPLTQDGQFWRANNNSVHTGTFRPTIPSSKEYKSHKYDSKYQNQKIENPVIVQGMRKIRQK